MTLALFFFSFPFFFLLQTMKNCTNVVRNVITHFSVFSFLFTLLFRIKAEKSQKNTGLGKV